MINMRSKKANIVNKHNMLIWFVTIIQGHIRNYFHIKKAGRKDGQWTALLCKMLLNATQILQNEKYIILNYII